jgi:hypothetical protein
MLIFSPPKAEVTGSNPVGCANDFRNGALLFRKSTQLIQCWNLHVAELIK